MTILMRMLTVSALGTMLAAAPALAQQQSGSQAGQGQQTSTQSAEQQRGFPSRVAVVAADSLAGRSVTSSEGTKVGEVSFVMIDMSRGTVPYLIIGAGYDSEIDYGGRFVAVPWSAVRTGSFQALRGEDWEDSPLRLAVNSAQIQQAQRYSQNDLYGLTDPDSMERVYGAWGYDPRSVYGYGYGYPGYGYGPGYAGYGPGYAYGPGYRGRVAAPIVGNQQGSGQQQQSGAANPQDTGGERRWVIVDPYGYANFRGPRAAQGVTGMQVLLPDGNEAEIDHVMIDANRGRVAYVLLSVGGFLGVGDELLPVPLEALAWSANRDDYSLVMDSNRLMRAPVIDDTDEPHVVSGEDLASLYNVYGVRPYWQ